MGVVADPKEFIAVVRNSGKGPGSALQIKPKTMLRISGLVRMLFTMRPGFAVPPRKRSNISTAYTL